jgi:hypothetical protein
MFFFVLGKQYFSCVSGQGVFIRLARIICANRPKIGYLTGINCEFGTLYPEFSSRKRIKDNLIEYKIFISNGAQSVPVTNQRYKF